MSYDFDNLPDGDTIREMSNEDVQALIDELWDEVEQSADVAGPEADEVDTLVDYACFLERYLFDRGPVRCEVLYRNRWDRVWMRTKNWLGLRWWGKLANRVSLALRIWTPPWHPRYDAREPFSSITLRTAWDVACNIWD